MKLKVYEIWDDYKTLLPKSKGHAKRFLKSQGLKLNGLMKERKSWPYDAPWPSRAYARLFWNDSSHRWEIHYRAE